MEKEELVEMINSTINTNGSGAITGEALNLALQAIVETMRTGSGSGAEKLQGYFNGSAWVQTEEEKALNAQLYTKIVSTLESDSPISVRAKITMEQSSAVITSTGVAVASSMVEMIFVFESIVFFVLLSDGSVQIG